MSRRAWALLAVLCLLGPASPLYAQPPSPKAQLAEAQRRVRTRDHAGAVAIWRTLAERDVREAQYRLGVAYRTGRGVERNHDDAARWLRRAAEAGHASAAFTLGTLYEKGWGVPRSQEQAHAWFDNAARWGHPEARERIVLTGGETQGEPPSSDTPAATPDEALVRAIRDGNALAALDALQRGAKVAKRDARGRTPLHQAAQRDRGRIASSLLRYRAEPDAKDPQGVTPLMLAAEEGQAKVLAVLLDAGARRDARDTLGRTPLMLAARAGHGGIVDRLLKHGADPKLTLEDGRRAYDLALRAGHEDIARSLERRGAGATARKSPRRDAWLDEQVEQEAATGISPLVSAASRGQRDGVASLLARPATRRNLDAKDGDGHTALSRAAAAGHSEIVRMLLDAGADATITTPDGQAPLSWAAAANRSEVVRRLLEAGAAVDAIDGDGRSALAHAALNGAVQSAKALLQGGAPLHGKILSLAPLVAAAAAGSVEGVALLVEHDDDPQRQTAALCASLQPKSDTRVSRPLLERWPQLAKLPCPDGRWPLGLAVRSAPPEVVGRLLAAGAKPDASGSDGVAPLILAARRGDARIVSRLLDVGADVDARGPSRETALTEAASAGHLEAVDVLLQRGADAGARTRAGYDARELAKRRGHDAVVERLAAERGALEKLLTRGN